MSPSAPRTAATSALRRSTIALLGLALAAACRPEGEAEPATTADASADSVVAAAPAAAATAVGAGDGERALANTAAPVEPEPPEEAIAQDAAPAADAPPPQDLVPDEPYSVLILGDSLAATGFGALLERKLDAHPHVVCHRKGKSASGLARPDFFDWAAEAKRQVEARKPDLVVVIMGGNDGQDLTRLRGSKRVPWQDEAWPAAYRERMEEFLGQISAPDRKILWLGLPHMGLRSLEKKLVLIRQVQQEAVEALGTGATYLDTLPYTTDEAGATLASAQVGKKSQKIRADDKIHFTMPGSEYFAARIYPDVLHVLSLPDVEAGSDSPD